MNLAKRFLTPLLLLLLGLTVTNYSMAQCVTPVITSIGNNGPVCAGGNLTLNAAGTVGGVSSGYVRMAGIGGNMGTREFNVVFSSGDRPGTIARITHDQFNALAAGGPSALRAQYDVLLFTWNTSTALNASWSLIEGYLALGGSVFWEDEKNIGDLAGGISGFESNGTNSCSYTLVTPAPYPALVANGVTGCFVNHHLKVTAWPSWMQPYIKVGSENLAIAGVHPTGGGRLIVQGPDQDFHAVRNGGGTAGNQYTFLLNQLDFLVAQQTGISWTGPNGFTSSEANPIITGITAAGAGIYTAKLTNVTGGGCFTTATTNVVVNSTAAPVITGNTSICNGQSTTLTAAGTNVQWYNAPTGGSLIASGNSYTTPVLSGNATYYAQQTANGCVSTRTQVIVTVNTLPTSSFTVSGGGGYCFGTSGTAIGLSGSQTGVNYQLMSGATPIGSAVAGTGNALSFTSQTAAGTYTVVATNTTTNCASTMTGNAVVTAPSAALSASLTTTNPTCGVLNDGTVTVNSTAGGIAPYQYNIGSGAYGSSNVLGNLTPGIYQVNVKDAAGCVFSQSASIIKPFCSVAVNDSILNCGGLTFNIPLSQLLGNDTLAAGDTISVGDWSTNATGGGTVTYNSTTKIFTYTPPSSGFNGQVSFTYTIKKNDNTVAFSGNGHFYEYKAGTITWTNAKNAANALYYNGMQGYLATVTSAAENAFINTKISQNSWMGASDLASEGTWRWVTGPEGLEAGGLGRHFSTQNKLGGTCAATTASTIGSNYHNWVNGEPNDCGANPSPGNTNPLRAGEHVAHFYAGQGNWNDFPDGAGVGGYVVEYGGMEVVAPVTLTSTATVFINNATIVASSATVKPACPGGNDGTITVTANGGATPYQFSKDNGTNYQSSNSFTGLTAGTYTMRLKDANGCTVSHNATVAAGTDVTAPTVSCPSNVTVNATAGLCNAVVTYAAATGTDNCTAPNALTFTYSQNSGTTFPVGVTAITVTARDATGNTSAPCSFTVTVLDVQNPVITCPSNIVVSNGTGFCGAVVNYTLPTATDNCGGGGSSTTKTMSFANFVNGNGVTLNEQGMTVVANNHYDFMSGNGILIHSSYTSNWTNTGGQIFSPISVNIVNAGYPASYNRFVSSTGAMISPTSYGVFTFPNTSDWRGITSMQWNNINNGSNIQIDEFTFSDGTYSTGPAVTLTSPATTASGSTFPVGTTTVSYKATDASGNVDNCSFTVTVNDTQVPVVNCPSNVTVNAATGVCNAVVTYAAATGTDNCTAPGALTFTYSQNSGTTFPVGTTAVTVTAKDAAGNTSAPCTFNVTVLDTQVPVITCPSNVTVNAATGVCNAVVAYAAATGTDNCTAPGALTFTYSQNSGTTFPVGTTAVTVTAKDAAGNTSAPCTFNVTVLDTQVPVITCPGNVTMNATPGLCGTVVNYTAATGTDNCTAPGALTFTYSQNAGTSFPVGSTVVTVTAKDAAGNMSLPCTFIVTILDVEPPVVTCPTNIVVSNNTGLCGAVVSYAVPTATDNCSGTASSGAIKTLTFPAFNDFNAVIVEQGMNISISNGGHFHEPWSYNTGLVTGTGLMTHYSNSNWVYNAGQTFSPISVFIGEQPTQMVFKSSTGAMITPTTTGLFTFPNTPDWRGITSMQWGSPSQSVVTIDDFKFSEGTYSTGPTVAMTSPAATASGSTFPVGTTTVSYKATDGSGNVSNCSFTVTVNDTQVPTITAPANVVVKANSSCTATGVILGTPVTGDNCAVQSVANDAPATFPAGNTTVTWTVTDVHNNINTATQLVTVNDSTAPVITLPANTTVACNASTATSANGTATATDNCSAVAITYTDASTQDANANNAAYYNYVITRTWKAVDVAGNTSTADQTITVQDVVAPFITVPANATVSCDASTATSANGVATGTDNCSPVAITYTDASTQDANVNNAGHYNYVITRTWTATDVTGNNVSAAQTITVKDITNPVVTVPANTVVNCQDATTIAANGTATGTDNCSPVAITYTDASTQDADINASAHYNYVITRTWTATDVTGNNVSAAQTITVQDITNPVVTVPSNTVVNCQDATTVAANGTATGTDNCSPVAITSTDVSTQDADVNASGHYNYVITRTWTATDVTGNNVSAAQTITVQDITNPVVTLPSNTVVNCQDATTIAANGTATGTDNCSPVAITSTDVSTQDADINASAHYNYVITRTWKATDVIGNSVTANQTITVQDVTNPAIVVPSNTVVNCQDATTIAANGTATGTDNCSPVAITSTDASTQDADINASAHYNYVITRTWKATDVTGNSVTTNQTITVQDVTNPVVTVPANTTVNCEASTATSANGVATGTDNCSPVAITYTDASTQDANVNNAGHYNYVITRTWKATDVTGNYVTSAQTITVQDITAPAITCPSNQVVSCQSTPATTGTATATDACSPVAISYTDASTYSADVNNPAHYTYVITRTWKAMDITGNFSTCAQTINVQQLKLTAATTNILCHANSTGAINLTVQGGIAPLTYSWSNAATTEDISNLPSGTYNVTVTDAAGCTVSGTYTLTQPSAPVNGAIAVSPVQTVSGQASYTVFLGYGPQSVTLSASATGGTPGYTYSWSPTTGVANPNSAATSVTPLVTTNYTVTITDANGCVKTVSRTIYVVDAKCGNNKVSICHKSHNCNHWNSNSCNSSCYNTNTICVSVNAVAAHLAHGDYLGDCLEASGTVTNVACNGATTGAINLSVTGGIPPCSYSWSNAATTEDVTGLAAGNYTVSITDASNRVITESFTVSQPSVLNVTGVIKHACFGNNNGSINVTVTGGTASYTYKWENNATTQDRNNLSAGNYTLVVTDNKGCTKTMTFTITQPTAPLSLTAATTHVSCNGGDNGAVDLTVNGGTGPYSYDWNLGGSNNNNNNCWNWWSWWCSNNNSSNNNSQDVSNLGEGNYSVTVTDANGCTVTGSYTITEPAVITASAVRTNTSCYGGSNGTIDLSVSGGTSPYTYSWSNSATTQDITGLSAGNYTVVITDAKGCNKSATYGISQPSGMTISGSASGVSCTGGSNGSVNISVSGGNSPYTYSWTGGATTQDISGKPAGTYTVTVTATGGCTATQTYTITQPASLPTIAATIDNNKCYGENDGEIDLTVTGGTSPYSYKWNNNSTSQDRNNLTAGSYSVIVTDNKGCTASGSYTVTQPTSAISVTSIITHVSCNNGTNGAINITVAGGSSPYTYNWYNGSNWCSNNNNVTTQDRTNLDAGSYSVKVTDAKGCTKTLAFTVTEPNSISASVSVSPTVTVTNGQSYTIYKGYGVQSVTLSASANGGTPGYTYSWSPTTGVANPNSASTLVTPNATTTYAVTITDSKGCTKSVTKTVRVVDVRGSNDKIIICHNGNLQQVTYSSVASHLAHGDNVGPCEENCKPGTTHDDELSELVVDDINVYPNPTTGLFRITLPTGVRNAEVVITDATGKLVERRTAQGVNAIDFNLGHAAAGTYFIRVTVGSQQYESKVVIK